MSWNLTNSRPHIYIFVFELAVIVDVCKQTSHFAVDVKCACVTNIASNVPNIYKAFDICLSGWRQCVCVWVRAKEKRQDTTNYIIITIIISCRHTHTHILEQSFPRARANVSKHSHTPVNTFIESSVHLFPSIPIRITFWLVPCSLHLSHSHRASMTLLFWHPVRMSERVKQRTHNHEYIYTMKFFVESLSFTQTKTVISRVRQQRAAKRVCCTTLRPTTYPRINHK